MEEGRDGESKGRVVAAPDLLPAFIHRSAWNSDSRKYICRNLNIRPREGVAMRIQPPLSPDPESIL